MRSKMPLISCFVAAMAVSWAAPTVQIFTDPPSPQPVGTVVGISAVGKDEGEPDKYLPLLRYRLSIAEHGDTFHIVRDFSSRSEFAWRPELYEHNARVKVTVLNTKTKQTSDAEVSFRIIPRVSGENPVAVTYCASSGRAVELSSVSRRQPVTGRFPAAGRDDDSAHRA